MKDTHLAHFNSVNARIEKLLSDNKTNTSLQNELLLIQQSLKACEADNKQFIKERNELEDKQMKFTKLYNAMLNNLPEMDVYLFDRDGKFVLTGGKEKSKYGYTNSDFLGKTLESVSNELLQNYFPPLIERTIKGEQLETEFKNKGKFYKIITEPIYNDNDEVEYGILIGHNITKLKKTQQKLKKSKIEAENIARSKSNFLANMSHEIRTPLNAIIGFSEQLAKTQLSSEQKRFNDLVNESSDILLSLVNEILILLKIGMGKVFIDRTPFDVRKVFEDVYQFFRLKAERKGIELMYVVDDEVSPVLVGDPFRLKQVIINLVSNAIKFTDSGSVRFSCSVKKDGADKVRLRIDVKDTGIGIPEKDQAIIFDEFSQSENMIKEQHGGSGLGLTISKKLVELQKGRIKLKSEPGKGSHFSIVIPYQKGTVGDVLKEEQTYVVNTDLLKGKRILLADDDQYNRELANTILSSWEVEYDLAMDGEEALIYTQQKKYDVVLMDIHMPKMGGVPATQQIRSGQSDNINTKIIALTANVVKGDIKEYLQSGMDDYIIKPYTEEELFNKIGNVLGISIAKDRTVGANLVKTDEKEVDTSLHIDLSDLHKAMRGNKMMINKMLQSFIDNTSGGVDELKAALANNDWDAIRETAHRLVSSFRYFKIEAASGLLKAIEENVVNANYTEIPKQLNSLFKQVEGILLAVENEKITE
ncbi:ATP-binding protein [Carboxylicivirga linearis]|uniref:histidine kinase n=1 Tax=Carboxylicivirga linearis TaxID=1628157 RepID=A0ABS5JVS5_9BACT|nr:ATP-binding protein [Carboxylicivirga linearis]MBS2098992.1 response regulator [Carboxylicivirga linearis]